MLITARVPDGDPYGRGVIGHARSADLEAWEVGPPLASPRGFGHLEVPRVADIDGRPMLMFSCWQAMIGLGVGIDYALFMVTRHRAELAAGREVNEAIAAAVRTSGRAIVFAGGTVVVSLLGLLLIGMDFLKGFAVASSLTVAIAVAAAITLVPALLAVFGLRINRLSIHRRGHVTTNHDNLGRRWARLIQRHPVTAVVSAARCCCSRHCPCSPCASPSPTRAMTQWIDDAHRL